MVFIKILLEFNYFYIKFNQKKRGRGGEEETWLVMVIQFRPQEVDLSGKTSAGGNGNGGDGNVSESRGDGAVEGGGAGGCSGGDDVGGGDDGAERR